MSNENKIPRAVLNPSTQDSEGSLSVCEGNLPTDLHGYVFIVMPVPKLNERGNNNTFMNGDPMIYRLDFSQEGQVKWKRKIAKSLDFLVDEKIKEAESNGNPLKYSQLLKFRDFGVLRLSALLGMRNEINTAFLPIKFEEADGKTRLLVNYDAGYPYEINTETLEVVAPFATADKWPAQSSAPPYPFPIILSSAHPVFDNHKQEMFTVNYYRSISSFANVLGKLQFWSTFLMFWLAFLIKYVAQLFSQPVEYKYKTLSSSLLTRIQILEGFCRVGWAMIFSPSNYQDDVYLMKWDSSGNLEKPYRLVDSEGGPIKIRQSMHQIGVTENYVVLIDTSFLVALEQLTGQFEDLAPALRNAIRKSIRAIPSPNNKIYIVERSQLQFNSEEVKTVTVSEINLSFFNAYQVNIPREISHFLVDYHNDNKKITLHASHICAWDIAQWIREGDRLVPQGSEVSEDLLGMHTGPMDVSWMGRHVIDTESLSVVSSALSYDSRITWGAGFYAYGNSSNGGFPGHTLLKKFDKIYWLTFGLWEEVTTKFMREQYEEYEYRTIQIAKVLELAQEGIPCCFYRLNAESVEIEECYQFPKGNIALSPQFVPKSEENGSVNGYITCLVIVPEDQKNDANDARGEIWIFDAANLESGPVCKLFDNDPELKFGLGHSLHTAWLEEVGGSNGSDMHLESPDALLDWIDSWRFSFFCFSNGKRKLKQEIQELFRQELIDNE